MKKIRKVCINCEFSDIPSSDYGKKIEDKSGRFYCDRFKGKKLRIKPFGYCTRFILDYDLTNNKGMK